MFFIDLNRQESENEYQYTWRLGNAKESGLIDVSWGDIAELINKEFRSDESEYRTDSAYRKPYSCAKRYFEAGVFNATSEDERFRQLQAQKDEVYKEQRKLYDQRREHNKVLASEARADHLAEELIRVAETLNQMQPLQFQDVRYDANSHKEAVMFWADWHYGMVTDNIWNKYNTDICIKRVEKFINISREFLALNNIGTLDIVMLGDSCHGAIHSSCRVESEENVCDQIMHVSEIMAQAVSELSKYVNHISVYSCYGNHLRTIQNKRDSIHSDNMEKLIPWWLEQRLKDNPKVEVVYSDCKEFTKLNVLGYNVCCLHGDLDDIKNVGTTVNAIFSKKFGETIDYTVSGDKHHLEEFENFGIESILVRSLCGVDSYANGKRLYSKPGQTLMIFNDLYGREATYHIPLE